MPTTQQESQISLSQAQLAFQKTMTNSGKFKLFALTKVPMLFFSGTKLVELSPNRCQTALPFTWLNKNPFKSIYFAVQSMAAELSTASIALLAIQGYKPSIAVIVTHLEANFFKKATGKVHFTCEEGHKAFEAIRSCLETGEAATATMKTVGMMENGTVVSEFIFTWSFKQRSK